MQIRNSLIVTLLLLTGCAASRGSVFTATRDPAFDTYPQDKLDKVSIGWLAHSGTMAVSTITRISPSDWVPRSSVVIRESNDTILVCYSVVHRSGQPVGEPPVATRITFLVPGIQRDDSRKVLLSSTCGSASSGA
ncbi:hypothetical protein [Thermomonas sp.]|uniref:hypothetical protein n=1 Tax=Thermomonas sp. TaxID=1971895 RepID=UPI00263319DE|nr:hypothetical protein [Thermomonas sp.]MCO5056207.1 hypothetical protein [Thermomonas sp.]